MDIAIAGGIRGQLRRSARRRTIGIKVHRGSVVVSAPVQAAISDIQAFVEQKTPWVQRHLARQQQQIADHQIARLGEGETLLYLGQRLTLCSGNDVLTGPIVDVQSATLQIPLSAFASTVDTRKALLAHWFASQAMDYLGPRVTEFAKIMRLTPKAIKVRHYKTRWGSCNRRGELQFNWLLMMAPPAVIDYVVVHELAHLEHFNHSGAFWQLVASVIPQYIDSKAWLKQQTTLVW